MDDPIEGQENANVSDTIATAIPVESESPTEPIVVVAAEPVQEKAKVRRQKQVNSVSILNAESATETVVIETEEEELPKSVKLAAPYAFYDDGGALRSWSAGQVVEDSVEIAMLVDRGVLFDAE